MNGMTFFGKSWPIHALRTRNGIWTRNKKPAVFVETLLTSAPRRFLQDSSPGDHQPGKVAGQGRGLVSCFLRKSHKASVGSDCSYLLEDFLCFVVRRFTVVRCRQAPHEGRILLSPPALTISPHSLLWSQFSDCGRDLPHNLTVYPVPSIAPAISQSDLLSCCLSTIVFTGGWETGPYTRLFVSARAPSQGRWGEFVRTVITISVRPAESCPPGAQSSPHSKPSPVEIRSSSNKKIILASSGPFIFINRDSWFEIWKNLAWILSMESILLRICYQVPKRKGISLTVSV